MDVKELQEEHGYAGDGTRYDGLRELHFRVWHEDIKAREDSRHEYESKQFDEETGGGTEQEVGLKMSGDGIYKDVEAGNNDYSDRNEKQQSRIVDDDSCWRTFLFHLPDVIEDYLDVIDKRQDAVKHEHQAYSDDYSAFGMCEV